MKSVLERLCALEEFIKGTRKKFEECSRKAGRPRTMSKNSNGARKEFEEFPGRKIRRVKNDCILDSYATINYLHPTDLVMSNWMDILLQ